MKTLLEIVAHRIVPAAYDLLPSKMASTAATRQLLATNWQESRAIHRAQIVNGGGRGPARGLWQFEAGGGVRGVLEHRASREHARQALHTLGYDVDLQPSEVWALLEHNDVLAAVFARLLLWTDPRALPESEPAGWSVYLRLWRPGKPHPETWAEAWRRAHEIVQ